MKPTQYRIVAHPQAHLFEVACTVHEPNPAGQAFRLPAWSPGSYLIRESARHFVSVRAESAGAAVAVHKTSKDTWQLAPCAGPLTLLAEVYAFDNSVRAAYLDQTRGFFNGPTLLVWPVGLETRPCEIELVAPVGTEYRDWRVATSMRRAGADPYGFGRYAAANYDELIDHPVEMGLFTLAHFDAGGARHDIAVTGAPRADLDRVARDLQRVCQAQIDLLGEAPASRAPLDHYLFQVLAVGEGHGGLEHRASTSLICGRDELPAKELRGMNEDYRSFLGLASHEYFHTWNVKRIKPAAFMPYDLTRENYTTQLWAFEGITSYYDDLMLLRSGVIGTTDYLDMLGRSITRLLRAPGRARQSLAEASFDAWIKYYRQDDNTPNATVSYYVKGSLVALALDLTLRSRSATSLDDVMRALWRRYGQAGLGVPEDGVEAVASEISGLDLADFFGEYVYSTQELPLPQLLQIFGVEMNLRRSKGSNDKGGKPAKNDALAHASLGATWERGLEPRLKHVYTDGPAAQAGLSAGDVIVAVDGLRASAESLERLLKSRTAGDAITVHVFRGDALMTCRLTVGTAPADTCWLALADSADAAAIERRDAWLGRRSATPAAPD
jgi:predicted metalloprotease with PDZ domain